MRRWQPSETIPSNDAGTDPEPVLPAVLRLGCSWSAGGGSELVACCGHASGSSRHDLVRGDERGSKARTGSRVRRTRPRDTGRPRGKFLLGETIHRRLLPIGRACCSFDELSHDVQHNRILRATLRELAWLPDLDAKLRTRVQGLLRRFPAVTPVPLRGDAFRSVQLHRNNAHYALLMHVCSLIQQNTIPDERGDLSKFRDFRGDPRQMGLLFEAFVRNLLRREQVEYRVKRENVWWDAIGFDDDIALLPRMQTDTSLVRPGHRIVIETKFTNPYVANFGKRKLRSDHLAQLYAYLANLKPADLPTTGVLLYPSLGSSVNRRYQLGRHDVFVRSIDLDRDWQEIRDELRWVIDVPVPGATEGVSAEA